MAKSPSRAVTMRRRRQISFDELHRYLYEKTAIRPLKLDELKQKAIQFQQQSITNRRENGHNTQKQSIMIKHPVEISKLKPNKPIVNPKLSRALESFPQEVQLCTSSQPGMVYGVCAKTHIPTGTWIGPYEGRKVRASTSLAGNESLFSWEIFQGGELAFYLDGSNEDASSWMRFISCARNNTEQNLYAFQYCGNIYYRAFKEIPAGTELLVWYDDMYPQFMGIPLAVSDLGNMETEEINANIPQKTNTYTKIISANDSTTAMRSRSIESKLQPITESSDEIMSNYDGEFISLLKRPYKLSSRLDATSLFSTNKTIQTTAEMCHDETELVDERLEEESGLGAFRCGQCDKVFPQRSVLQMHMCSRSPNKPYQCGFCGNAFANPNELRAHAVSHCNEKPFKCGYCSRSFSGATTLNNHIRTHTGEKPFNCEKCGKTFAQGSQLSRHQRLSNEC